ncbi:MAG: hypothetical protein EON47_06500 [Acetobacteraceae bacterium]|nr:MAG: hypothetical protein EON47_06500 [Acetobacteraceae bacterium]
MCWLVPPPCWLPAGAAPPAFRNARFASSSPRRPVPASIPWPASSPPPWSGRIGQTTVFENQGGANGLLAAQQVARAEPDGHTLLLTDDAIVLASLAQPEAGIGFDTAFAPVTQAVRAAQILVAIRWRRSATSPAMSPR